MSQEVVIAAAPVETAVSGGVYAVIPARGGSKGVPHKNIRTVGGEPIIARAVRKLHAVAGIDAIVVSTDDPDIARVARSAGAQIIGRPDELSGDLASSESALRHALEEVSGQGTLPDVTVFVQATSPFISPGDVERAIQMVRDDECDVAFSVARTDVHLWREGPSGPEGVNHDAKVRRRRQERVPEYAETGAFYVMRTQGFIESGHRFFGRVEFVEVDPSDALEIDTEHDLRLAELIVTGRNARPHAGPIPARAVVTDFDGVHTDDRVFVDQHGIESVQVNRSDGMGVALLRKAGIPLLILSSETNEVVRARAAKLGVDVITGCDDKLTALGKWADSLGIPLSDIAYLGNDVNDVACLHAVGWPVVVADAHTEARRASTIVLRRHGGDGAVRELADRVLSGAISRPPVSPKEGHDHG
ncbi:MAG: acylneuraminate cytidylyltransferase [Aeromicrobium sp.]